MYVVFHRCFRLRKVHSIPNSLGVFNQERNWVLSNDSSVSIKMVIWFFSFILLIGSINVCFIILNQLCIPQIVILVHGMQTIFCAAGFCLLLVCLEYLQLCS